ncbi:MAG: GNAT family N-acetyltransferase [Candidatus Latescibacterota bacterium]|nr:MAG: GNAT family N-acetyltransferase [Candidatus Latescibacterota bacterium]
MGHHPVDGIVIRPCVAVDLESVTGMVTRAQLSAGGLADQFGERYVVAEFSGQMIGCAGVEIRGVHGLLRSVAVTPDRRGAGIGARLVRDRLDWARSQGISTVYLLTETAAGFFRRFGFETITRNEAPQDIQDSHEYAVVCPSSAELMRLRF